MAKTTLWMIPDLHVHPPYLVYFRNCFKVESDTQLRFRFSAEERAMLFLDGKRIAEGPERSGLQHWHYGEVTVPVSAGEHILSAQLLALGPALSAYAQMSWRLACMYRRIATCSRRTGSTSSWTAALFPPCPIGVRMPACIVPPAAICRHTGGWAASGNR